MIYEWKEWITCFFLNKAHFFRKLFCKEYIRKKYVRGGACKERYVFEVGFLDCYYKECPKRKDR